MFLWGCPPAAWVCHGEEPSDEAISTPRAGDCFAALALTELARQPHETWSHTGDVRSCSVEDGAGRAKDPLCRTRCASMPKCRAGTHDLRREIPLGSDSAITEVACQNSSDRKAQERGWRAGRRSGHTRSGCAREIFRFHAKSSRAGRPPGCPTGIESLEPTQVEYPRTRPEKAAQRIP
jgi:hypothetical protein